MKKIIALLVSLIMIAGLWVSAFAAVIRDGDKLYDDASAAYTYVNGAYMAGGDNYLPHFEDEDGVWYAVGGAAGKPLHVKNGGTVELTLGSEIKDRDGILYHYKAEPVEKQDWSCRQDQLKQGFRYENEDGDTIYCVQDKQGDIRVLVNDALYTVSIYEPIRGQHLLYSEDGADVPVAGKVGVYEARCAACDKLIQYQKTNVTVGNYLYQDVTMPYPEWCANYAGTAAKPEHAQWITGYIYVIGENGNVTGGAGTVKPPVSQPDYAANTAVKDGATLYSGTASYTYVDAPYKAGEENYLPHFVGMDGMWYTLGGPDGTPLRDRSGQTADLTLGGAVQDYDALLYEYEGREVASQAWSCTTDALRPGWKYVDENGDVVYCVADQAASEADGGFALVRCGGSVYRTVAYEPVKGQHLLYTATDMTGTPIEVELSGRVGVYEARCAACGKMVQYQRTNLTEGEPLRQDLTKEYPEWLSAFMLTAAKPDDAAWVTGAIYLVGVSSSAPGTEPPAAEPDPTATTTLKNGDVLNDRSATYVYVNEPYEPGQVNYAPHFQDSTGTWYAIGGKNDTPLYGRDGKQADLNRGDAIRDEDALRYDYQGQWVDKQVWSCHQDQIRAGFTYADENDDTVYCVLAYGTGEPVRVLYGGRIYDTISYVPITGQHLLYNRTDENGRVIEAEASGKVGVYWAKCAACGKMIQYQHTNIAQGGQLRQDLTLEYADWAATFGITVAKPLNTEWTSGSIYVAGESDARTDVNGDGRVSVLDVARLYELITGSGDAETLRQQADVNNDGQADVYDLQRLYEIVAGIRDF